ncbi:hypothetical protein MMC31_004322 [Peltigera leucophlebia]|nr:hypothetical protein [Peltigera leucophlebia]
MPSLIHLILSLTTIIVSSLAYLDSFDVKAGDVTQPLIETAVADNPDGLGNPTLGFDVTSEADDWRKIADTSNGGTGQAVVPEQNDHRCSNTDKRRREIGKSCSFNGAPLELRPYSAQERKPSSRGQFRKTKPRKKEATPGSSETPPTTTQDLDCPPGSWAVCGANEPLQDFLNPGTFREVPWLLDKIPPIIEVQLFCRYWYPQNQCDTTEGRELPMCCKRVELRSSEFPVETLGPFARVYILQYPYLGFFCEPLPGIPLLP